MDQAAAAADDYLSLYRRAFEQYGVRALWNKRLLEEPTPADALVVARALRIEGDREARFLAERIEQACRAALPRDSDCGKMRVCGTSNGSPSIPTKWGASLASGGCG